MRDKAPAPRRRRFEPIPSIEFGHAGAVAEGSFYYVDTEIEEEDVRLHLVTVTLAPEQVLPQGVVISADLIQAELAAYIGDFRGSDFAWEFTISIHLAGGADPCLLWRRCGSLSMACLSGGVRSWQQLTHILKEISEPVGKLVTVDLASFEDDGPARIEILCPVSAENDGMSLIFYFGARGRRLTLDLEFPVPEGRLHPAPTAFVPRDEGQEGDGGSSGRAPAVRRMTVMLGFLRLRMMAGSARVLLVVAIPVRLLTWHLGLWKWSGPDLPMSQQRRLT
ncbi:hypothetical protein ZWY2020_057745 [Hordeum vulgare]|nr:hypothetical protein ZWY2020_057745 [Hordeum vulgare]